MQDFYNAKFIFKNKEFDAMIKPNDLKILPKKLLTSFVEHNKYEIQANVSENVFKSFIKYLTRQIQPDILKSNIDEYEKLNNELQIPLFTELIQYNREFFQYCHQDIDCLFDNNITDKSEIEHRVSIHLNQYIKAFGHVLLNLPIQSLYNIFSYPDCNFSLHEYLFDLINSHCENNKKSKVFILLQFIDGNFISEEDLHQSYKNSSSYFGFKPKFNFSVLMDRIHELNHSKIITYDGLQYRLFEESHTAEVSFSKATSNEVNVPRSIIFQSQEYVVKSIAKCESNHNIKSINFSDDSEIKRIDFCYINCGLLNTIFIPSNVEEIIIFDILYLSNFIISPNNKHFVWVANSYLLGKSDKNDDDYDILIFAPRIIENVTIPSNIKILGPYCFDCCYKLTTIKFEENSKLQIIGKNAFNMCFELQNFEYNNIDLYYIGENAFSSCFSIKTIIIPPYVTEINEGSFFMCLELHQIEFSENSDIYYIGNNAFSFTSIESIDFPLRIKEIGFGSFESCSKLHKIDFPKECKLCLIKSHAFCKNISYTFTGPIIKEIIIPQHVTRISKFAFYFCSNLQTVIFAENSELISIGKCAFSETSIETIKIPSNVRKIKDSAFSRCQNLKKIDIDINSKLCFIGEDIFSSTLIESLTISSNVKDIRGRCFRELNKLYKIIISQNNHHFVWIDDSYLLGKSNQDEFEYDILIFARRNIEHAIIPSYIKQIDSYCFSNCDSLKTIEFPKDSKLEIIDESSFSSSSIKTISIPPYVKTIRRNAFSCCKNLENIEFLNYACNCSVDKSAFDQFLLEKIKFPPNFLIV